MRRYGSVGFPVTKLRFVLLREKSNTKVYRKPIFYIVSEKNQQSENYSFKEKPIHTFL